jgi:hypothetical protein
MVLSWAPPDSHPLTKIIVVGVAKEESLRRAYEDTFSKVFTQAGITTTPSYKILGTDGEIEKEKAVELVREAGFNGVFITRLVRLTKNTETSPSWGAPIGPAWGPYPPYWGSYYYDSYRVVEREFAYIESNLYDAKSDQLLLSVLTRTENVDYSQRQIDDVVKILLDEARKHGLVALH